MKKLGSYYRVLCSFLFNPAIVITKLKALPYYLFNGLKYSKNNSRKEFSIELNKLTFKTIDRFLDSGDINHHYFHQDLWASTEIYNRKVVSHVDIGSRIDGFIAHILPFCKVKYVDIRPLQSQVTNLDFVLGSLLELPFESDSIESLSCLHVIEHIGLGRYGDEVDAEGHIKAAKELSRVLQPGGVFYFSTPVGEESLYFDAHRIFSTNTILELFKDLKLLEFNLIDDASRSVNKNASFESANKCVFGCGLFIFTK